MHRILLAALALSCAAAIAQPAPQTVRVRGTVEKIDATTLVVKDRQGATVTLVLAEDLGVGEVLPIDPAAIQSGSFVGTTAVPGPDGSLSAVEVHVFPEAARGRGEGHSPYDLLPGATMTNATVTAIAQVPHGRSVTLRYKEGEKTIFVPDGIPIVTTRPADRSLLVPGAQVIVSGQVRNGQPTALRVTVGRNGFVPPM
jgi:hypothetical protein